MPLTSEELLATTRAQLQAASRILIVSHLRPDGDAIGSLLGLGLALQAAGKDVQMVLSDGVPGNYRHLAGSEQIRNKPEGTFDLTVVTDSSDLNRVGPALNGVLKPDINIDHHPTNLYFARLNLVEAEAVATSEMLAKYLPRFAMPISQPVASALLTGLITDTLGFRTSNVSPDTLRVAADLMEAGADLPDLYNRALHARSFVALKYWGSGLVNLDRRERLAWTTLSLADRRAAGYPGRDDADLINLLSAIEDIDIVVLFVEQSSKRVKVSWRAQSGFDVSQIALAFGGGGHKAAAGAEIDGPLMEVQTKVLEATRNLFDNP
jgi:phosphoesterase RecJ-like protein